MKQESVKLTNIEDFNRLKSSPNALAVFEDTKHIVFANPDNQVHNPSKVSSVEEVLNPLEIKTGVVQVIPKNKEKALEYFKQNNIAVEDLEVCLNINLPEHTTFEDYKKELELTGLFSIIEEDKTVELQKNEFYSDAFHWDLAKCNIQESWGLINPDNPEVIVAVIDGHGCDIAHEDLQLNLVPGYNAVTDTDNVVPISDYENHSTSCVGIVGATFGNNLGVQGRGGNLLKVMPIVVGSNPSPTGSFSMSSTNFVRAINKCKNTPNVKVISMSFGSTQGSTVGQAAITDFIATKGSVFASTGNSGTNIWSNYPASYTGVIGVASTNSSDSRSSFSNYGGKTFLAAPGSGIWTTDRMNNKGYTTISNYYSFSGTSAACPHAATLGGLLYKAKPELTDNDLKENLKLTSFKNPIYSFVNGWAPEVGYGRVNYREAVALALNTTVTLTHNLYCSVMAPSTANTGAVVNALVTVYTNSPNASAASFEVKLELDNVLVNTAIVTLGDGVGSATVTIPVLIPNSGSGITRVLKATADSKGEVNEPVESDNTSTTNIFIPLVSAGVGVDAGITVPAVEFIPKGTILRPNTPPTTVDIKRVTMRITNTGTVDMTSLKFAYGFTLPLTSILSVGITTTTFLKKPGAYWEGKIDFKYPLRGDLLRMEILQVNGGVDNNPNNNTLTINM